MPMFLRTYPTGPNKLGRSPLNRDQERTILFDKVLKIHNGKYLVHLGLRPDRKQYTLHRHLLLLGRREFRAYLSMILKTLLDQISVLKSRKEIKSP
jgi:hypothetical protein